MLDVRLYIDTYIDIDISTYIDVYVDRDRYMYVYTCVCVVAFERAVHVGHEVIYRYK